MNHLVAIFGGAVAGAEAAFQLSLRGIHSVVFDQHYLPFGKIEDGLPKWHARLRDQEESRIVEKLSRPEVTFVPGVRLGETVQFKEIWKDWGFSAILLAIGAWRDRPLPIDGIDDYIGKGLLYQNTFIQWYNHQHEPDYHGPRYETPDGAIIVGGGLASFDVAKVLMFENVQRALANRGQPADLFELDRGINKALESRRLTLADLGIEGCTLYYRRRPKDMPLTPMSTETPEQLAKAQKIREKILGNFQEKYLFRVVTQHTPVDKIVENGRLAGLVFQRTRIEEDQVIPIPGTLESVRAPLVISSIGSIPEEIPGIPMRGQVFDLRTLDCCRIAGFDNVFALGNAVTGRGNIRESAKHSQMVAREMAKQYLEYESHHEYGYRSAENLASLNVSSIAQRIHHLPPPDEGARERIAERVNKLQQAVGYDGDLPAWVERHRPVRLEEMMEKGD